MTIVSQKFMVIFYSFILSILNFVNEESISSHVLMIMAFWLFMFHLLVEFDDSKHSCCRRLEGHNERRRKRQFNILSGKPHKLLQQYQGMNNKCYNIN